MKISPSRGVLVTTGHTILTASTTAGGPSVANKSTPGPITIIIDALSAHVGGMKNSDSNYYNIIFPDHYVGTRGAVDDPLSSLRSESDGVIDYAGEINVIFNIPVGMSIGGNTSGNYGTGQLTSSANFPNHIGARNVLRKDFISSYTGWATAYVSDPSLVINLDTHEWAPSALSHLNITINNSGNTIGAGGSGSFGNAPSADPDKHEGGGGGGAGQGLHPAWPDTGSGMQGVWEIDDNFISGEFLAGQPGEGHRTGTVAGWGANGTQSDINSFGTGGAASGVSTGQIGQMGPAQVGGSAVYVHSNVATVTTGTTINIVNKSTGRMYGGGGGGPGGVGIDGGDGGSMRITPGTTSLVPSVGTGTRTVFGGWMGNVLWWQSDSNLVNANTIINENTSYSIGGHDGSWG